MSTLPRWWHAHRPHLSREWTPICHQNPKLWNVLNLWSSARVWCPHLYCMSTLEYFFCWEVVFRSLCHARPPQISLSYSTSCLLSWWTPNAIAWDHIEVLLYAVFHIYGCNIPPGPSPWPWKQMPDAIESTHWVLATTPASALGMPVKHIFHPWLYYSIC